MGWSWQWFTRWWPRRRAEARRLTERPRRRVQEGTLLTEPPLPRDEGPVTHASPETRRWVQALTSRWPPREQVTQATPNTIAWLGILTGQPGVYVVERSGRRMQVTVDEQGHATAIQISATAGAAVPDR